MTVSLQPMRFYRLLLGLLSGFLAIFGAMPTASVAETPRPNIVLIYADDLGYGDVGCYGATRIRTPNIDRLASEGLRFTDAHAPSATCTPSRYAMLTGEYAWRKPGTGILPGDAGLIIAPGRTTLASILGQASYTTGVVGKWHLGLGKGNVDWNGEIKPGPLEIGFQSSFLMAATGDRVPCVYVENHRVAGLDPTDPIRVSYGKRIGEEPTGLANPDLLRVKPSHGHNQTIINGISRIGFMEGGKAARWNDEEMSDVFTRKAVEFIERAKEKPFFLYFAAHEPHVPRVPHPRFAGKSGCGVRGDVIEQFDWCVGEILGTLDRLGLAKNTLVILSSDNGPVVDDGYHDGSVQELKDHKPAGPFRGGKYSLFEAGTRVPFIVRWPSRVKPGVSNALISQVDLPATFATLTGQKLQAGDAPDSVNVLPALLGESVEGREALVEHADGLALRKGPWKFISPTKGVAVFPNTRIESGRSLENQLYNLETDPGETRNVAGEHPERVEEMAELLRSIREQGSAR